MTDNAGPFGVLMVTEQVLLDIGNLIAAHPPERGGVLLGPPFNDAFALTRFIYDTEGSVTGASYVPSDSITRRVREVERTDNLILKGIVHSHPAYLDRPSGYGGDATSFLKMLNINPHLLYLIAPIVTSRTDIRGPHEHPLSRGKISFFVAYCKRNNELAIEPVRQISIVQKVHLASDVSPFTMAPAPAPISVSGMLPSGDNMLKTRRLFEKACEAVHGSDFVFIPVLFQQHNLILASFGMFSRRAELKFVIAPLGFPVSPPVLGVTSGSTTKQMHLHWDLTKDPEERLTRSVRRIADKVAKKLKDPHSTSDTASTPSGAHQRTAAVASFSGSTATSASVGEKKEAMQPSFQVFFGTASASPELEWDAHTPAPHGKKSTT